MLGIQNIPQSSHDTSSVVAFRRGGVEGLRPSTNRLAPARGGRAVGVAPGRLAAAGEKTGAGRQRLPEPLHRVRSVICQKFRGRLRVWRKVVHAPPRGQGSGGRYVQERLIPPPLCPPRLRSEPRPFPSGGRLEEGVPPARGALAQVNPATGSAGRPLARTRASRMQPGPGYHAWIDAAAIVTRIRKDAHSWSLH